MAQRKCVIPLEYQEQQALVQWLNLMPALRPYLVKITNEGKRTVAGGYWMQRQGMCAGASDLFFAYPVADRHGFWLEMKRRMQYSKSDMASPRWLQQLRFLETMRAVGYEAQMCYGFDEGKAMIESYLCNGRAIREENVKQVL